MSLADIQRRLASAGFDTGYPDGICGRQTEGALNALLNAYGALLADLGPPDPGPEPDVDPLLLADLRRDEGTVLHAYQDHLGFWTIGTGRLIDKRKGGGISQAENDMLLANDVRRVQARLDVILPWWRKLDPVRQRAVTNMAFQLGPDELPGATYDLIREGRYAEAAKRLDGWLWAKQTPERAKRVIAMIRDGAA
jgi:lysozyme